MAGNEIHLDNFCIGELVTQMEDLERRVDNFHAKKTYDEIFSEVRDGLKKISPKKMTLDDYKAYIEGKIQNIPRNFTRYRDDVTVCISDAGFQAMKDDSSYETWVLDSIREDLSFPDYLCGYPGTYGRHEVIKFGETKEDYRGYSSAIHKNDSPHVEEENYWQRRLKRLKARLKAEQELFEHEKLLEKACDESAQVESIKKAAEGLIDPFAPQKPIVGVPAEYLLAMFNAEI